MGFHIYKMLGWCSLPYLQNLLSTTEVTKGNNGRSILEGLNLVLREWEKQSHFSFNLLMIFHFPLPNGSHWVQKTKTKNHIYIYILIEEILIISLRPSHVPLIESLINTLSINLDKYEKVLVSLSFCWFGGSTPCYGCMLPPSHKLMGPTSCKRRETYIRNRVYFLVDLILMKLYKLIGKLLWPNICVGMQQICGRQEFHIFNVLDTFLSWKWLYYINF